MYLSTQEINSRSLKSPIHSSQIRYIPLKTHTLSPSSLDRHSPIVLAHALIQSQSIQPLPHNSILAIAMMKAIEPPPTPKTAPALVEMTGPLESLTELTSTITSPPYPTPPETNLAQTPCQQAINFPTEPKNKLAALYNLPHHPPPGPNLAQSLQQVAKMLSLTYRAAAGTTLHHATHTQVP